MTPEELALYSKPKLQKLFREKMREWQVGDWYYNDPFCDIIADIPSANRANRLNHGCLRLPLPIDPNSPERGLWGMVDWDKFESRITATGLLVIETRPFLEFHVMDTPTLALLKALDTQVEEGGEG
jgi:hypothetical protein